MTIHKENLRDALIAAAIGASVALVARYARAAEPIMLSPPNGANTSGTVTISCSTSAPGTWVDIGIDGAQQYSSPSVPFGTLQWNTTGLSGAHTIDCQTWRWNDATNSGVLDHTVTNMVTVNGAGAATIQPVSAASPGAYPKTFACSSYWGTGYDCTKPVGDYKMPTPSASPAAADLGPGIGNITGDAPVTEASAANPASGNCPAGLVLGGPLPNDAQAAQMVQPAPKSTIETGPNAQAQAAADSYYELNALSNPAGYQAQLNNFWSAWGCPGSGSVYCRVDGAMPIRNATTAMVFEWAAHKWNLQPALLYSEASNDGHWDITALGDGGCSVGPMQVADCRPEHTFPGFTGISANLAAENMAFNADMYAATIYGAYTGSIDQCAKGNISISINQWLTGLNGCSAGTWSQQTCDTIASQGWSSFFNGQTLPN